jgi:mycofactocin glycosyltransferase
VRHAVRADAKGWVMQRVRYGTSAAALHRRHPGALPATAMSPWSFLAWLLAGLGHPIAGAGMAATTAALFTRKVQPPRLALRLAGRGHLGAGRLLAEALRRPWIVPALAVAVVSRRARWWLLAAFVTSPPTRWIDDVAYGVGVTIGCWRERTIGPLLPRLTDEPTSPDSTPGRSS